jgi:hypothetical protein
VKSMADHSRVWGAESPTSCRGMKKERSEFLCHKAKLALFILMNWKLVSRVLGKICEKLECDFGDIISYVGREKE